MGIVVVAENVGLVRPGSYGRVLGIIAVNLIPPILDTARDPCILRTLQHKST